MSAPRLTPWSPESLAVERKAEHDRRPSSGLGAARGRRVVGLGSQGLAQASSGRCPCRHAGQLSECPGCGTQVPRSWKERISPLRARCFSSSGRCRGSGRILRVCNTLGTMTVVSASRDARVVLHEVRGGSRAATVRLVPPSPLSSIVNLPTLMQGALAVKRGASAEHGQQPCGF